MTDDDDKSSRRPPVRFQMILSADTVDRIDWLKDQMDYSSRADVLRSAVRLLELAVSEGNELWIKDKEGKEYRYRILIG